MKLGAVVQTLRQTRHVFKTLELYKFEHGEDYRAEAREALTSIIEKRMEKFIDVHLAEMERRGLDDRKNGFYKRHFLESIGDLELDVPRTRSISACEVLRRYSRRAKEINQVILAGFVLGLSTRKVGKTLLSLLGERISPTTVSNIAKTLDEAVARFHQRPLADQYEALLFDGVVLGRRTGAGAVKRPVLVALGLLKDGRKEIIDYQMASGESQLAWETFLTDLYRRGLVGKAVKLIVLDGGKGLLAALPTVYPTVPVQRCWVHKIRNCQNKCRVVDWKQMKKGLHRIMHAISKNKARQAARRFADRWGKSYPKIVQSIRDDLDSLTEFYRFSDPKWRKATRSTNAIERRFKEVRRRTRPMGVFSDRTSMDRILFAVFMNENKSQGVTTPFLVLTQNN
jgi:putative transposase